MYMYGMCKEEEIGEEMERRLSLSPSFLHADAHTLFADCCHDTFSPGFNYYPSELFIESH